MNERIAKLYDQAIVLEGNGDYVAGELDPEKFAELIVRECMDVVDPGQNQVIARYQARQWLAEHFGVNNDQS